MSLNPITIEALQILDAIDRRGSFAKAAEDLNKATSALSYGVQKLEEQLDVTVFQREGRRSVLSPAGRLLLNEGRKILNTTELLAQKAKEVANGWEPRLRIAIESTLNDDLFFQVLAEFLDTHQGLEVDVRESVLSGGWDALEHDQVDLIIGSPGPVPVQKGFRATPIGQNEMLAVIADSHPLSHLANDAEALRDVLPKIRRVVSHDTAAINVGRSVGLSMGKQILYVQSMDQKVKAQLAGLGIGHLPRHRIQQHLDSGELIPLASDLDELDGCFIAWKISNKGKALQALCQLLIAQKW